SPWKGLRVVLEKQRPNALSRRERRLNLRAQTPLRRTWLADDQHQRRSWRIVHWHQARRCLRTIVADGRWQEALPNERCDLLGGQRARAEEARLFARKVDNRRFDAQRCPSSVQDRVDAVAQIVQHVF